MGRWISALILSSVLATVYVPAASAEKFVHRVVAEGPGTAAGQSSGSVGDVAVNHGSVADGSVDPLGQSTDGYAYVVDDRNHRINVFSADGEFQFTWGQGVLDGNPTPQICDRSDVSCTGGFAGAMGGAFNRPEGVAIDQDTGHVFVRERLNLRVQEFTAAGEFVRAWGWDVVAEGTANDTGSDQFETCFHASECKVGVTGSGLGQFARSNGGDGSGIDVDQSTGDVYVGDPENRRIQHFDVPAAVADSVTAVKAFGSAVNFVSNVQPVHIAIDGDGILYASDGSSFGAENGDQIERYDLEGDIVPGGGFLAPISISAETATTASAATRGLEIDPATGNLYIARDTNVASGGRFSPVLELGNPGSTAPGGVSLVDTHVQGTNVSWTGIGFDPDSGDLYLAGFGSSSRFWVLAANEGPVSPSAGVVFLPASGVSGTAATLNVSIDPQGSNAVDRVDYEIQIAESSDPDAFRAVASGQVPAGAPVTVSAEVTGLRPRSFYLVRVVTSKAFANPQATTDGPTLLTPAAAPTVLDVGADSIGDTSARLRGRIDPNGTGTRYRFEYGVNGFQHAIPVPDGSAGSGYGLRFVSEQLTGLQPDTTYQYRLVATSDDQVLGATTSQTKTFMTAAGVQAGERAFELVSPADKYGGQGTGFWPWGLGHLASAGVAAHEKERFMLTALYGSSLSNDGAFGLNTELMFAERVDDRQGWRARPVLTHPNYQPSLGQTAEISGSADDFSRVYWKSPATLTLFPEMAGPNADPLQPNWSQFDAGWLSEWNGFDGGPTRWELMGPRGLSAGEIAKSADLVSAWGVAISGDGSAAFGMTGLAAGKPAIHGLAGSSDPTLPAHGDLVGGRSIYAADLSDGLSDTFAGVGQRVLVNVCTGAAGVDRTVVPGVQGGVIGGQECLAGIDGRPRLISDRGAAYSSPDIGVPSGGIVSRDGSRVFFLSPDPRAIGVPNGVSAFCAGTGPSTLCPPQLYVRQRNPDGSVVTRWVSKAQDDLFGSQAGSLTGSVRFEGASRNGKVVFFRTNSPLTVDDPNGTGGQVPGGVKTGTPHPDSWDLYRFKLSDGPDPTGTGSSLTRVSAGPDGDGDCVSPRPEVISSFDTDSVRALRFLSDDGSRAYFTCQAPLPGVIGAPDGATTSPGGTTATADQTNLYLYEADAQSERWRFIARLPRTISENLATCASTGVAQMSPFVAGNGYHPHIGADAARLSNCVRGSGDGRFLTWFTTGRLTRGMPADSAGPAVADIYGYDAERDELLRLTAAQGGSEVPYPCATDDPNTPLDESAQFRCRGDGGIDSQLGAAGAAPRPVNLGVAVDPARPGARVAFFQSASRLVPEDLDSGYDVYEWRDGRLALVTSGASDSQDALYKGNDRSGRNVYFVTKDALSWQDTDAVPDVYSARVGGGIAQPQLPAVCAVLAGGCQPVGGVGSVALAPATGSADGGGNAKAGVRGRLAFSRVGARAVRRAVRTGRLAVRVRATAAGRLSVVARALVAKRRRVVARAARSVGRPGVVSVSLRLSAPARRALRAGRRLEVSVSARQAGVRQRSMTVRLGRGVRR